MFVEEIRDTPRIHQLQDKVKLGVLRSGLLCDGLIWCDVKGCSGRSICCCGDESKGEQLHTTGVVVVITIITRECIILLI